MKEENKLGQKPAFPYPLAYEHGMSKRFYAACAAMQGMLANSNVIYDWTSICNMSYELADELLKQENNE